MHDPARSENPSRLVIVFATYNECETLPILVSQLHSQLPHARMIVIDDNSPDGTGRWCDEFSTQNSFLQVFHRHGKLGLGSATVSGLKQALEMDCVLIATMDSDLSHDPRSLRLMYELFCSGQFADFGVMIGSRYVTGGKIEGWPWYRRISSATVNLYCRIALGLQTKDNTSAFRIYRAAAIKAIDLDGLNCPGFAYLEELLVNLRSAGVSFMEYPITFKNRTTGKSKVGIHELGSSLLQIARLGISSRRGRTDLVESSNIEP
jgi:dolichol-phosphate mannosyltransferase